MKKITFGTPEEFVPSKFCSGFNYMESDVAFETNQIVFKKVTKGIIIEWKVDADTQVFGFGLQLKRFNFSGYKVITRVNADPVSPCGESHAPVPFLLTNKGYGIYFDTARYAEFYCGRKKVNEEAKADNIATIKTTTDELYAARQLEGMTWMSVFIPHVEGIDMYVIEGKVLGKQRSISVTVIFHVIF